jgi:hypothetical protein
MRTVTCQCVYSWYYTPSLNMWALASGGNAAVQMSGAAYGSFRVPSSSNIMAGRWVFGSAYVAKSSRIYIMGGVYGLTNRRLNDIWMFDTASNTSAWIGGTQSIVSNNPGNFPAVTGIQGGALGLYNRGVSGASTWTDPSGGLWYGFGAAENGGVNDLWWMPSPAPVVTVELTVFSSLETLRSPLLALSRVGTNNVSLGWPRAFTQDLNFSIISETGTVGSNFTVRIVQLGPRSITNWSVLASGSGGYSSIFTDASSPVALAVQLPASAALGAVSLVLTIPGGATVVPAPLAATVQWVLEARLSRTPSSSGQKTVLRLLLPSSLSQLHS